MANGAGEREGTPRMYKKTWIVHSANIEELEELEELEEPRQLEEDYYV